MIKLTLRFLTDSLCLRTIRAQYAQIHRFRSDCKVLDNYLPTAAKVHAEKDSNNYSRIFS